MIYKLILYHVCFCGGIQLHHTYDQKLLFGALLKSQQMIIGTQVSFSHCQIKQPLSMISVLILWPNIRRVPFSTFCVDLCSDVSHALIYAGSALCICPSVTLCWLGSWHLNLYNLVHLLIHIQSSMLFCLEI